MDAAQDLSGTIGVKPACAALGLARASYYKFQGKADSPSKPSSRTASPRSLKPPEKNRVLEILHSPRFVDKAPLEIYATLLDEKTYVCSTRTMYRILESANEVKERRNQLRHPQYQKPELLAVSPNEVWTWDITKLLGPVKWNYFYLYVILDIFSRYVVGWMVAQRESAKLAERLIEETSTKQGISAGQLTIHADRGSSMRSKTVALLLADMGITKSHSRPYTSTDNPYSEAQFKTLKYRPEFPKRFGSIQDARSFCQTFFNWYNNEHRHSGIGLLTPFDVHHGHAQEVYDIRQQALNTAYAAHPERFVRGRPRPPALPEAAWINQPKPTEWKQEDLQ